LELEALVVALDLDMRHHWQPTAEGYFGRVSKGLILEAVREGIGPGAAAKIDSLEKTRWRNAPRPFSPGKAWLPTFLR
jgi:ParB family transcriptional regulator, chromosome partitioning protein